MPPIATAVASARLCAFAFQGKLADRERICAGVSPHLVTSGHAPMDERCSKGTDLVAFFVTSLGT
ncbi:hypothetical protein [Paraburkholderia piptadeniae]|uniref:hypothetical protein n=1 Tax=Paraburkholderia piptadeniae TaxID=1701573 RepID=UPI001357464B|nr:hypothetical protein [Paraburkholderia piptadeniae]